MIRKLVMASATAAVVAGMGLASPAHGDSLVDVTCDGPTFGDTDTTVETGGVIGTVTAVGGDAFSDLLHDESIMRFDYACGNGNISNVGNTAIEWQLSPRRHVKYVKHEGRRGGPPPWVRGRHEGHSGPPPWVRGRHERHSGPPPWARGHHDRYDGRPPSAERGHDPWRGR